MITLQDRLQAMSTLQIASVSSAAPVECLLLDLKGAAGLLGISIWTLRDLVTDGFITAHRIGRKDFIKRTDLVAYAKNIA